MMFHFILFFARELVSFKKKKKDRSSLTIFVITANDLPIVTLVVRLNQLVFKTFIVNVSFYLLVCQSCDTHKEQLASSRENGKILSNQTVSFESNQSPAPGAKFVSHKE